MAVPRKILRDVSPRDRWGLELVTVTLRGEQWTALLARFNGVALSPEGAKVYNEAATGLRDQILTSSNEYRKRKVEA